jgi:hypothetical protein
MKSHDAAAFIGVDLRLQTGAKPTQQAGKGQK